MHQIRDWLYIGNYRDTINRPLLDAYKIGAMLHLAERVEQPGIKTMVLLVDDGVHQTSENLKKGINFIRAQKAAGHRVIVACGAGISRSTTYALGALKEEEGGTVLDNLVKIKAKHPNALPHIRLWHSINQYYGENTLYQDIWPALRGTNHE
jgi:protein-tyrosine phosphatase